MAGCKNGSSRLLTSRNEEKIRKRTEKNRTPLQRETDDPGKRFCCERNHQETAKSEAGDATDRHDARFPHNPANRRALNLQYNGARARVYINSIKKRPHIPPERTVLRET